MSEKFKAQFRRFCRQEGVRLCTPADLRAMRSQSRKILKLGSGARGMCVRHIGDNYDVVAKKFTGRRKDAVMEAEVLRYLQGKPGVQRLVAVCLAPPVLVTEYAGCTLDMYAKKHGISYELVRQVVVQVGASVQAITAFGLQHNDIKPNNVCVQHTPEGLKVTLIDFNSAAKIGDVLFDSPQRYTAVWWMAPEILRGRSITERSDTFSLATLCLDMLSSTELNVPYSVLACLEEATRRSPSQRPSVKKFIDKLTEEVEAWTRRAAAGEEDDREEEYKGKNEQEEEDGK